MDDCIFCKIVKGELPNYTLYEDDTFLSFLDIRPLTRGNALVIPKKHYRWVYDVPNFGDYWEVAKKVGIAGKVALGAQWIQFLTIGHEVPHAHIRVMPRYEKDLHKGVVDTSVFENLSKEEMQEIAEKIKKKLM